MEDPIATPEPPELRATKSRRRRRAKTDVTVTINPRAGGTKRKAARAATEAIAAVKRVSTTQKLPSMLLT